MGIGRCDAGAIELRGRERQLVALARHAHLPRPLHIEPLALAPGACERAVDVDVDADLGAFGRELVGWHHVIDQRLDESSLVEVQELVALGRRWGGGLLRLRARSRNGGCGGRRGRTARDRRFQEITPAEALIRHVFLPASGRPHGARGRFLPGPKNAPFPVPAARLFDAGTASTHLESCNGLPTTKRLYSRSELADLSSRRVASLVHNRGRSRARGRNPNAGATQRRRTNLGRAGSGWAPVFATSRKP